MSGLDAWRTVPTPARRLIYVAAAVVWCAGCGGAEPSKPMAEIADGSERSGGLPLLEVVVRGGPFDGMPLEYRIDESKDVMCAVVAREPVTNVLCRKADTNGEVFVPATIGEVPVNIYRSERLALVECERVDADGVGTVSQIPTSNVPELNLTIWAVGNAGDCDVVRLLDAHGEGLPPFPGELAG